MRIKLPVWISCIQSTDHMIMCKIGVNALQAARDYLCMHSGHFRRRFRMVLLFDHRTSKMFFDKVSARYVIHEVINQSINESPHNFADSRWHGDCAVSGLVKCSTACATAPINRASGAASVVVDTISLSTFTNEKFLPQRDMPQVSGLFCSCFAGISEIVRLVSSDSNHCITPRRYLGIKEGYETCYLHIRR
jgi:hypothetical protein